LNPPPYLLIEEKNDLDLISAELQREPVIAVDLEADSMFHFKEKVCLLQISTRSRNFIIDPIAVRDPTSLAPVFSNPDVRKIFHGADYDIRCLHRFFHFQVHSLFDTQIAARFLGLQEVSLAGLLREFFGIGMEKKYQKKDWSRRPLPPEMLSYAAGDACHLIPLAEILEQKLRLKGRLSCVEEECKILSGVRSAPLNDDPLFMKFKGASGLDRRSLAVLEAVLQFRLSEGIRKDRPVFKVMGDGPVMEITEKKPVREEDLRSLKGLSPRQIKEYGPSILQKVREALSISKESLPVYPRRRRNPVSHRAAGRIKTLKDFRDRWAQKLGVDPSVVLTTAQINSLALENPGCLEELMKNGCLKRWQVEFFGHEIKTLLNPLP
jgi:ribonuclease D